MPRDKVAEHYGKCISAYNEAVAAHASVSSHEAGTRAVQAHLLASAPVPAVPLSSEQPVATTVFCTPQVVASQQQPSGSTAGLDAVLAKVAEMRAECRARKS